MVTEGRAEQIHHRVTGTLDGARHLQSMAMAASTIGTAHIAKVVGYGIAHGARFRV